MSRIRHQHYKPEVEDWTLENPDGRPLVFDFMPNPDDRVVFKGATYEAAQDKARLSSALRKIAAWFRAHPGREVTLKDLAIIGGCSEAGASMRFRDCRRAVDAVTKGGKPDPGLGMPVSCRRVKSGLWVYWCDPLDA